MYKTPAETVLFCEQFLPLVRNSDHCEIVICPPFPNLPAAVQALKESPVKVGAQNLYWGKEGAFTGEVSGHIIRAIGCSHVIVGHSERRQHFGESDEIVLKKTVAALHAALIPVVCMGERLDERETGIAQAVLKRQFRHSIAGLSEDQFAKIVIAYEPVWAIGTGRTATPEIAAEAHAVIRSQVQDRFGQAAANSTRILYGGSVKPDNTRQLMAQPEIDGLLVGGASLDPQSFASIVNFPSA